MEEKTERKSLPKDKENNDRKGNGGRVAESEKEKNKELFYGPGK